MDPPDPDPQDIVHKNCLICDAKALSTEPPQRELLEQRISLAEENLKIFDM
jgi:hypothetical protein